MKNILILYTNYGTGHYMAAIAIKEYIEKTYPNYKIEVLDPLSFSRPIINKLFAYTGKVVATKFRKFRKNLYKKKMYQDYLKNSSFFKLCTKLFWTKKLKEKLTQFNPDIIISTQVGPTGLIAAHKELFNAKLISVFTDYGLHRMYVIPHEFVDIFCVPNESIKSQMLELGIEEDKIKITGIPVRLEFLDSKTKKLKLPKNKPIYLFVCGGGLGYDNAFSYFEAMLKSNSNFYYIFVSGKNEKLLNKAKELVKNYDKDGEVLGYVNNMFEYMAISDMVIGKPGGIITSESLNLEVPFCAVEPIPGQETNNALFISNNKFGFYITNLDELKDLLNKLNKEKLEIYKKNIKNNFIKSTFIDI